MKLLDSSDEFVVASVHVCCSITAKDMRWPHILDGIFKSDLTSWNCQQSGCGMKTTWINTRYFTEFSGGTTHASLNIQTFAFRSPTIGPEEHSCYGTLTLWQFSIVIQVGVALGQSCVSKKLPNLNDVEAQFRKWGAKIWRTSSTFLNSSMRISLHFSVILCLYECLLSTTKTRTTL